jgi:GT2 family glycosyltransferase/glycosyltransferase involved in cell wall biosynthesis
MNDSEPQVHREVARFEDDRDELRAENARLARELASIRRDASDQRRLRARDEARHAAEKARLEEAAAAAQAMVLLYERSRFWRLTAPLRAVVKGVRALWRDRDEPREEPPRPPLPPLRPRPGLAAAIGPLHLPASDAPRVSVIIPTFGHPLHAFTALAALAPEAARVPLEAIVMDDCGPVDARTALSQVTGVRFERNAANLGFVGNCNRGAALARGEFLLFLNDDAIVAPGALQAMLRVFDTDARAGAVGAKLVYPDGRLQEAGAIVWRDAAAWNYGRGDDPARPEYNYLREADYCSAACLMIRRSLFRDLGGFDALFAPAYGEDTDLCFRVREAGLRVYYQPEAEVVHLEGVSHGTDVRGDGVKRYQLEHQTRLRTRWAGVLAGHRPGGVLPRLERERALSRRVLFVEEGMLTPDEDSGSLRTARLLREMKALGCHVTFLPETLEAREPGAGDLRRLGIEVLHAPYCGSVEEVLAERAAEYDVIVLARHAVAGRHIDSVRRHAPAALLVFDTLDLHHLRERRRAIVESDEAAALGAEEIRQRELDCVRRSDLTWVVSAVERGILERDVPGAIVHVQTNIHPLSAAVTPFAQREGLLFVGGYRHPPNVDAAVWLRREIWPLLRERLPGVPLYLLGSGMPDAVRALGTDGVEAIGYVPDLDPWLDRCRVALSPLRYGAGVKGKVNHAMSRGLPVVATSASIEGMHLADGEDVLVADDPRGFADAVARLYRDEALWLRLSRGGRANVERHFSPEAAAASLGRLFECADRKLRC